MYFKKKLFSQVIFMVWQRRLRWGGGVLDKGGGVLDKGGWAAYGRTSRKTRIVKIYLHYANISECV